MSDSQVHPAAAAEFERLLAEAATAVGMEPGYWDIWGTWHETTAAIRRAILESLGMPCGSAPELEQALDERKQEVVARLAPPVLVVDATAEPIGIDLWLPAEFASSTIRLDLVEEAGARHEALVDAGTLPQTSERLLSGRRWVSKRVALPAVVPIGYHEVELEAEGHAGTRCISRLIVCPTRAWLPSSLEHGRGAGLAISLYGVHSNHTWGCGDFTALRGVMDWVADHIGGSFVAVNPLCAIHNRQPFNTSPYLPNSVLYRNFIYLDIDRVADFAHSPRARALRRHPAIEAEIAALNGLEFVEYERVAAIKRLFLRLLFRSFFHNEYRAGSARAAQFLAWVDQEGDLLDRYATYSALDEHLHRRDPDAWVWQHWPVEYHDPRSEAVERFRAGHPRAILFHKYVQWLIDVQAAEAQRHAKLRGLEIGLFHDLPLATDRCGFELWANREFYVDGCRVGAPPDDFSPKGQDWSFPPPNIQAHRADGYRLFAESIRKVARHGGALRLDHVMRLFRLYWIPDGFDATGGAYVRDRYEDLLRILALESHRQQVLIVGEDLGTVEPFMREALARFGILSYRLFYFEKNQQGEFRKPDEYPQQALVSSTTHDLPTLAGFWVGRDIEARAAAGLLPDEATAGRMREQRQAEKQKMLDVLFQAGLLPDWFPRSVAQVPELTGELHNAVTGFLVSTPSLLMTLNQEDLTKEVDQQNLPGTTWQYPNWRRKMRFSIEDLQRSAQALDFAAMFRHWLGRAGRTPPSQG